VAFTIPTLAALAAIRPAEIDHEVARGADDVLAAWSGIEARQWGRKPLLLIAFGVLPIRGILYTLTGSGLAAVAAVALSLLWVAMPETRESTGRPPNTTPSQGLAPRL
jgi:hypothetical protein